jgi:acyl-CoA thioesterase
LADTTAGVAAFTDGKHYVTQSGNFHFIGNVSSGVVFAEGNVIHRGRIISIVEVEFFSEEGKLLGDGTYDMFVANKPFWNVPKDQRTTSQNE